MHRIESTMLTEFFCLAVGHLDGQRPRPIRVGLGGWRVWHGGNTRITYMYSEPSRKEKSESSQIQKKMGDGNSLNLSRRLAPGLFFLGFFLPMVESGSPQILILPIAESSVVHKQLGCGLNSKLVFFRESTKLSTTACCCRT